MTDHTKALADALAKLLDVSMVAMTDKSLCTDETQAAWNSAGEALAAYRASEQLSTAPRCQAAHVCDCQEAEQPCQRPSTAVELPTPVLLNHPSDIDSCREALPVFGYTAEQLTAYGDARAAEARREALEEAADEADHWIGFDKTASDACDDIAAAIRALITKG
jgi:hypothetical protein